MKASMKTMLLITQSQQKCNQLQALYTSRLVQTCNENHANLTHKYLPKSRNYSSPTNENSCVILNLNIDINPIILVLV